MNKSFSTILLYRLHTYTEPFKQLQIIEKIRDGVEPEQIEEEHHLMYYLLQAKYKEVLNISQKEEKETRITDLNKNSLSRK